MRARQAFLGLLVALLLLQWGTAFAHCLRMAAPDWASAICTPQGIVYATGADVAPAPDEGAPHRDEATAALCPACFWSGHVALPGPAVLPVPAIRLVVPRVEPALPRAPVLAAREDRPPARAPPMGRGEAV